MLKSKCLLILFMMMTGSYASSNQAVLFPESSVFLGDHVLLSQYSVEFDGDGKPDLVAVIEVNSYDDVLLTSETFILLNASLSSTTKHPRKGTVAIAFFCSKNAKKVTLIIQNQALSPLDILRYQPLVITSVKKLGFVDMRGDKPAGHLIAIPSEAGIDSYLFWGEGRLHYWLPDEIP